MSAHLKSQSALDRLIPLVYDDLRDLARRRRAGWRLEDTPGGTSLVHQPAYSPWAT